MSEYIQHSGIVLRVEGEKVQVRIVQTSACTSCQAKTMCTAAESREKIVDAQAMGKMQVGDTVEVMVHERMGWKAILLAYILPFVVLVLAIAIAGVWVQNEALSGTLALMAVGVYYLVLYGFKGKLKKEFEFMAVKQQNENDNHNENEN